MLRHFKYLAGIFLNAKGRPKTTSTIRWQLRFGDHVIANVEDAHAVDWPWTYGTLVDSPQFERFRKYFTPWDLDDDDDDPEIDELIEIIKKMGEITLHDNKTNRTYTNPVFNHSGESVWFRLHEHEA
jgi:hypothetical protein